ncbi:MAG: hypothetical protein WC391_02705 [Methanoregula sp.]|jgi:hypothetical protein
MFAAKTVMLFGALWILLAFFILPAHASGGPEALLSIDTFPLIDNPIPVQQAHLTWLCGKEEDGMQATIDYLSSMGATTGSLSAIMETFHASAASVPSIASGTGLMQALGSFRIQTRQFRDETDVQMNAVHGSAGELRAIVHATADTSAKVHALEDQFWQTRRQCVLADFDQRVKTSQNILNLLSERGYEITPAQEKLNEISAVRGRLVAALDDRDDAGIEEASQEIHVISMGLARWVRDIQVTPPAATRPDDPLYASYDTGW